MSEDSPIGELILDAERKAKKRNGSHESVAACGCAVYVSWFTEGGRSVGMKPCPLHPVRKNQQKS